MVPRWKPTSWRQEDDSQKLPPKLPHGVSATLAAPAPPLTYLRRGVQSAGNSRSSRPLSHGATKDPPVSQWVQAAQAQVSLNAYGTYGLDGQVKLLQAGQGDSARVRGDGQARSCLPERVAIALDLQHGASVHEAVESVKARYRHIELV